MNSRNHPGLHLQDYQRPDDLIVDDRPSLAVVVALWSPNLSHHEAHIMHELTAVTVDTVRQVGARPVLIDSSDRQLHTAGLGWHEVVDGIVYLGGADIHPSLYSEIEKSVKLPGVDVDTDQYCIDSLQRALAHDVPLLGICRGSQLLNVALGGTIVEHIAGHRSELVSGDAGFVDEELQLVEDSKIAHILGRTNIAVRGSHHQSVDQLAQGLRVTARASDGIIEGTEHRAKPWVLGVQWHPEEPCASAEDRSQIFSALVKQAAQYRKQLADT